MPASSVGGMTTMASEPGTLLCCSVTGGAFFSHIVLGDDREKKKQMLAAVLGQLAPRLWKQIAESEDRRLGEVGHCRSVDDVMQFIRGQKDTVAVAKLEEVPDILSQVREQQSRGDYRQSIPLIRKAQTLLADAYLRSEPSVVREGRAWWNHSGTGRLRW